MKPSRIPSTQGKQLWLIMRAKVLNAFYDSLWLHRNRNKGEREDKEEQKRERERTRGREQELKRDQGRETERERAMMRMEGRGKLYGWYSTKQTMIPLCKGTESVESRSVHVKAAETPSASPISLFYCLCELPWTTRTCLSVDLRHLGPKPRESAHLYHSDSYTLQPHWRAWCKTGRYSSEERASLPSSIWTPLCYRTLPLSRQL